MSTNENDLLKAGFSMTLRRRDLAIVPPLQPMPSTLAELTIHAQRAYDEAERAAQTAVMKSIEAGKALNTIKDQLPHGYFEDYVAEQFSFTMRKAQNCMRLAKQEAKLLKLLETKANYGSHLTMKEALRFLTTLRDKKKPKRKAKSTI